MRCPGCDNAWKVPILIKARLDVYWCGECKTSWLIHKLSYKTFEEASEISDDEYMQQTFGCGPTHSVKGKIILRRSP